MTGDRASLARWVEWATADYAAGDLEVAADKLNRGLLATSACTGPICCAATGVAS